MEEEGLSQSHKTIAAVLKDLQPIRDLAKNWDIDIASCLGEYLQELEQTAGDLGHVHQQHHSLDGGEEGHKTNFAQAALLLHNSSHVYSRKVEYLYSLVYQALDSLASVHSQKKSSHKGRTLDPELEDFREFDPHQEFLLLDDVLPTDKSEDCRHINLVPTAMDQEATRRLSLTSRRASSSSSGMPTNLSTPRGNISMRTQNLSSSTMGGKSFHTLGVSKALSQISSQSNAVLRLMDDHCDLDPSGRLVVPGAQSTPSGLLPTDGEEYAAGGDYDGEDDDDDDPGFVMADDDEYNNDVSGEPTGSGMDALETAKKRVTFAVETAGSAKESSWNRPDPWALLDPHTSDSRRARPLRVGKTLKLPAGIDDLPSECVTGSRTKKWKARIPVPQLKAQEPTFFASQTFQALSRKRRMDDEDSDNGEEEGNEVGVTEDLLLLPKIPTKGLVYGEEFAYLAKEYAQRKAAERRLLRRRRTTEPFTEQTNSGASTEHNHAVDYDDDDDDYGAGYAFGDDDDDNDFGPVNIPEGGSSPVIETNTGLLAVEEVYRDRSEDDTDSVVDARAFEALCRAHIAKFAKGAEKYASETQLTQRVDKWQEKLEPLLVEEEARPVFDIHEYGQTILTTVEECLQEERSSNGDDSDGKPSTTTSSVVDFVKITKDCPNYQVCRYFLATLGLCNSGNVVLEQNGVSTNALSVKLLSTDFIKPMDTYLAPSAAVEQNM